MKINLRLSQKSIEQAVQQTKSWKSMLLNDRIPEFVKRVAELGVEVASVRFSNAEYAGENDVSVSLEHDGLSARIIANGKAVAFIEFGAGTSQPAYGGNIPAGIVPRGTYGHGLGKLPNGWYYEGEQGTSGTPLLDSEGTPIPGWYSTMGNPPAMAMLNATTEMAGAITEIWREVMA